MSPLAEIFDGNTRFFKDGQDLHRPSLHLRGGGHCKISSGEGERDGEKARRRSRRTDVERGASADGPAAAANEHAVAAALCADPERRKTGEHRLGVVRITSAAEKDVALAEGGKNERAVQQAFGGGDFRLQEFAGRKFFYTVQIHIPNYNYG